MATKIEILSLTLEHASVAFYYVISSPIAAAVDLTRTPSGARLSSSEKQDLKDGKLFEFIMSAAIGDLSKSAVRGVIESMWSDHEVEAVRTYTRLYQMADLTGEAWDGTGWS